MRRLVLLSVLLILAGFLLLLPSSQLWSLITTGSTTSSSSTVFRLGSAASSGTDNTSTYESLAGFGTIGVGLVLEIFSLFTDVGGATPSAGFPQGEKAPIVLEKPVPVPPSKASPTAEMAAVVPGFAVASPEKKETRQP